MQMINALVKSQDRQVVTATTLTPVRHKRQMQFLASAPNFRGSADPLTRPSRAPTSALAYLYPLPCF